MCIYITYSFFFFNDTATTEIYTLSLHDALPISRHHPRPGQLVHAGRQLVVVEADHDRPGGGRQADRLPRRRAVQARDRKSTRLNSSHANISYAVFCLKKKKQHHVTHYHSQLTAS